MQKRTAIVGLGAIGLTLLRAWSNQAPTPQQGPVNLVAVLVKPQHAAAAQAQVPAGVAVCTTLAQLLALAPDTVVEAAGHGAVSAYGPPLLAAGQQLVVVSAGALADEALAQRLLAACAQGGGRVCIPTGALAGLDGLRAMRGLGLQRVRYTSTKPPDAWTGTPAEQRFNLAALREPTVLFSGTAREAARLFPQNANGAATVALAGLGLDRTEVTLVAAPHTAFNNARIQAEAAGTVLDLCMQNARAPGSSKTSFITGLSVLAALNNQAALQAFV
jgi:aspartate dehydrogenase